MSDETTAPAVPLLREQTIRARSLGELLQQAAIDIPASTEDGVQVSAHIDSRGTSVSATVKVKDFSGGVIATRTYDGQREITGAIRWSF